LNRQLRARPVSFFTDSDYIMIGNPEVVVVAGRENSQVPHGT